ncbi:hypothetical protein [Bradyrhizobium jicamae]|uniref:hypothetical protein n=1 Tax=Bradyrhizobium jicamae TaxID=280332 RepID=UPI001BAC6B4A|nr:hypothetical protein [Bradyrhizobium jicamae]MBR0932445.1 hypothetical protein [Bradyrhizobium jicamae]
MAFNILPSAGGVRLRPVEARYAPMFCFALLTASCALASLVLACATPFAAFAVIAAAALPFRTAILVVVGTWLVNQTIGFGTLHYPIDARTIAWGFVIGTAALAATAAASVAFRLLPHNRALLSFFLAFVCGYAAYEVTLLAATPMLGGAGAFTPAIVMRLGLLGAVWLAGLVAVCEMVRVLHPFGRGRSLRVH